MGCERGSSHRDILTVGRIIVATHAEEPRVKVLSIVGTGRSGTTVLAAILGEVAHFFNAGELHWVWSSIIYEQRPCGCCSHPEACTIC